MDKVFAASREDEAKEEMVGVYRGHLYMPRRYPSGIIAGFWKNVEGKWTPPTKWLPDMPTNVVKLRA